jgi:hypothetical protein
VTCGICGEEHRGTICYQPGERTPRRPVSNTVSNASTPDRLHECLAASAAATCQRAGTA